MARSSPGIVTSTGGRGGGGGAAAGDGAATRGGGKRLDSGHPRPSTGTGEEMDGLPAPSIIDMGTLGSLRRGTGPAAEGVAGAEADGALGPGGSSGGRVAISRGSGGSLAKSPPAALFAAPERDGREGGCSSLDGPPPRGRGRVARPSLGRPPPRGSPLPTGRSGTCAFLRLDPRPRRRPRRSKAERRAAGTRTPPAEAAAAPPPPPPPPPPRGGPPPPRGPPPSASTPTCTCGRPPAIPPTPTPAPSSAPAAPPPPTPPSPG